MDSERRLKILWCIRKVLAEVISINFGQEQLAQISNFLITTRLRIEKVGVVVSLDKESAYSFHKLK